MLKYKNSCPTFRQELRQNCLWSRFACLIQSLISESLWFIMLFGKQLLFNFSYSRSVTSCILFELLFSDASHNDGFGLSEDIAAVLSKLSYFQFVIEGLWLTWMCFGLMSSKFLRLWESSETILASVDFDWRFINLFWGFNFVFPFNGVRFGYFLR